MRIGITGVAPSRCADGSSCLTQLSAGCAALLDVFSALKWSYNFLVVRNWLAIAAVGVVLAATPAWTQMRGARVGGARPAMGRAPVGQRGAFIPHSAPPFSSIAVNGRPFVRRGFRSPFFVGHGARFHHLGRRFFISSFGWSSFGWPYGSYGYYPSYPPFWDSYDASNNANAYPEQNYQLQQEISRLSDEVQRLREEQAERSVPPPPQPSPPQPQSSTAPPPPTTLVLSNGRTRKVDNYAIADGTLWVFTDQKATKIPLSELDIRATQKANEEQGVPFQVPPPAR